MEVEPRYIFRQIRNFVVIAHVDHGKSTLADRFLELTGTVEKRKMREQYLDTMALEREKGITIKMAPVRMTWHMPSHADNRLPVTGSYQSDSGYILNLIDTPGHVDFSYEVSRALACVEGAILLVDATQGIQAQTLANLHLAEGAGLVIIPAINKIDLPSAEVEKTAEEIRNLLGDTEIFKISAKTGEGVDRLLAEVISKIPPSQTSYRLPVANLRALVFDSVYDPYLGVVAHVRIFEGEVKKGERLKFLASGAEVEALEIGVFLPERTPVTGLGAGEIGYIATGIKEPEKVRVGDTITLVTSNQLLVTALPGYREPTPMVYASIFPENQDDYEALRESLKKLKLNDASLFFEPEDAGALGRGFRGGFLGMLHMEIAAERLRREYGLKLVFSSPSVAFRIKTKIGQLPVTVFSAAKMPERHEIEFVEEPWSRIEIITPSRFLGAVNALISEHGGKIQETVTLGQDRLLIKFEAPLREVVVDFYDKLKSVSQGFASMVYSMADFRPADLVRLDILVAGERVEAMTQMLPREKVYALGRERTARLKELLPRRLFAVAIQAVCDGKVIARETVPAVRKDVTGYLYGGDRTRKMKLWKKQQRGKKRLKEAGRVEIPPEIFWKMIQSR